MDPEERVEIGDMPRLQVSMKVKVIALSGAFLLVIALGLYASSPLIIRCLEVVQEFVGPGAVSHDDQLTDTPQGTDEAAEVDVELRTFPILQDDFLTRDPHWFWPPFNHSRGMRSLTVKNGSMFLNLTEKVGNGSFSRVYINDREEGRGDRWLYVDLEIRLRCSDDNGLISGEGKGRRSWGFMDLFPSKWQNSLLFRSISPESDPDRVGLQACGRVDGETILPWTISGIDIREWHNYTILWRPGNATFLIDGEVVASMDNAPTTPMGIVIYSDNAMSKRDKDINTGFYLDLEVNQSILVGDVEISMDRGHHDEYSNRMEELFVNFSAIVDAVDAAGLNSTVMRSDLSRFMVEWNETGYLHAEKYMLMLKICNLTVELEDIRGNFEDASEAIKSAKERNDSFVQTMEAWYRMAEDAWLEYRFDQMDTLLGMIIARK